MSQQHLVLGSVPGDDEGEDLFAVFRKIEANLTELYVLVGAALPATSLAAVIPAALTSWIATLPTTQPTAGHPGWWSNGGQPTYFPG